jgi:hypothetical protein
MILESYPLSALLLNHIFSESSILLWVLPSGLPLPSIESGWLVGLNFSPISEQKYFGIYGIAHICYGIFSTMCLSSVSLKALIVVVFWLLVFAIARVKDAAV